MPMHRVPAIALIAAFPVLAGCVHVTTDWNPKADFSSLSTCSFTSPPAETPLMNSLYNDELHRERVRSAIESDLKSKGYRLAGEGEVPTFRIAFFRVVDKKLTHPEAPDEQPQAIDKEVTRIIQKFPPGATSA